MFYKLKDGGKQEIYPKRRCSSKVKKCCLNGYPCCFLTYLDIVDNGGFCSKVTDVGFNFTPRELEHYDRLRENNEVTKLGLELETFVYNKGYLAK